MAAVTGNTFSRTLQTEEPKTLLNKLETTKFSNLSLGDRVKAGALIAGALTPGAQIVALPLIAWLSRNADVELGQETEMKEFNKA